jgi:hypothetical protein
MLLTVSCVSAHKITPSKHLNPATIVTAFLPESRSGLGDGGLGFTYTPPRFFCEVNNAEFIGGDMMASTMTKQSFESTMITLEMKIRSNPFKHYVFRPLIRVVLHNGERSFACVGLIDSGADYSTFPAPIMEQLGLSASSGVKALSVGSTVKAYRHEVKVEVPDHLCISPFPAIICFAESMKYWMHIGYYVGILGQVWFFDKFKVCFDSRNRTFDLDPYEIPAETEGLGVDLSGI